MTLEKIVEVHHSLGESSEIIDKLKEMNVCLESFFNHFQSVKALHNTKVYFKDIYKASGKAAFDNNGNLQTDFSGPQIKILYTYFDTCGIEQSSYLLIG